MKFREPVRLLERNGFELVKEKGAVRYYGKGGLDKLIRVDYHGAKEMPSGTCDAILKAAGLKPKDESRMIELKYSLIIEATEDPAFFTFYSSDLEGFTGVGNSVEDCLYKARWGMEEHISVLKERGLPVPQSNPDPNVTIKNAGLAGVR
jgi:predicted RNA binding protein YcfA (HicA-like mRNA interferase family)/predicted RNase H-like HicB family nuclease